MNKLNQKEELTQSTIPFDKSEISYSLQKETKKLTRLPFYKLEELKKQEEKKAKQRHKVNKKEDIVVPLSQILEKTEKAGKKKRIILKKVKDERVKTKVEEVVEEKKESLNTHTIKETNIDLKLKEVNKIPKIKTENYQVNKPPDHSGNSLKTLKYSADEIIHKKIKLSRKQRKLQEAENTLASFLSKEDKSTYYHNNSTHNLNKFGVHDEQHHMINNHDKNYTPSSLNMSSINNTNPNANVSHLNINTTVKKTDNNTSLTLLGKKKKKRISKFKKAVYKYRFKKKQFIFNNVFKLENEQSDVKADELIDNHKGIVVDAILDTNLEKANNKHQNESPVTINQPSEKSEALINSIALPSNAKPNFIEKINFYSQDHQQGINNIPTNNNIQTSHIPITYNLDNTMNSNPVLYNAYNYNNNQNNFCQHNYPYNYPQYFYSYYPMNMYNNQQYFNPQAYNYSNNNAGIYYNKFNVNFAKIPTGHYNANNTNNVSNIIPQIKTQNTDTSMSMHNIKPGQQALKPKKKKKKKKNKTMLNKFNYLDKKQIDDMNNNSKKEFLFEMAEKIEPPNDNINNIKPEEFRNFIKSSYHIDKDITNLNGIELNNYLKEHTMLKKVDLKNLQKIADENTINTYIKNFEGVLPDVNLNKRIIREYVDQILDNELDKKIGDFIVKMRDMYHKKKQANPLKAKKRFVVGMREIEKHIRLDEVKCLFVVPNIEKVEGENSLDDRIFKIFKDCDSKKIPKIFGMNKFILGKLSRKKYSCISMLAFVNVEGFERELRDLIEFAEKFRIKFYENYQTQKEAFNDNRFIRMDLFKNLEKPTN